MGERKWAGRKKRRTREHVLADISANYLEYFVYRRGHTSERISTDYGTDLLIFTYGESGEIENGHIQVQLKATDHLKVLGDSRTVSFQVESAHVRSWIWEPYPVILVVYDAEGRGRAFWLYIQGYFESSPGDRGGIEDNESVTLHIPMKNRLNGAAIERFRKFKDRVLAQVKGVIRHDG